MLIAPILVGNGVQVELAANESVFVSATSTVASAQLMGIWARGDFHFISVYGYVAGDDAGILLGENNSHGTLGNTANRSHVIIGENGVVSGRLQAIYVSGDRNTIINNGEISSANTGVILSKDLDSNGNYNTIVNRGLISAEYTAIDSRVFGLKLTNYGVIEVTGTQDVAIRVNSALESKIVNRGLISGGMILGNGSDRVDNARGTIDGTIEMGNGNDTLRVGAGIEIVRGGSGNDTLEIGGTAGVSINLATGAASGGWAEDDQYSDFESIRGTSGSDVLIGDAAANGLEGRGGNDRLEGGDFGDLLAGGMGNDILVGGKGSDSMRGGEGADTFVFADGDFGGTTFGPADLILDYVHAEKDRIDLSRVDANTLLAGNQAFTFINAVAFTKVAGQLRVDNSTPGFTMLTGDTNGDGVIDFAITFNSVVNVYAADLVL